MIPDILAGLVRANLAASVAILLIWAIRKPVRGRFGAQAARQARTYHGISGCSFCYSSGRYPPPRV